MVLKKKKPEKKKIKLDFKHLGLIKLGKDLIIYFVKMYIKNMFEK